MSLHNKSPSSSKSSTPVKSKTSKSKHSQFNRKFLNCFTRYKYSKLEFDQPRIHNMEGINTKISSSSTLTEFHKKYPCADSSTESTTESRENIQRHFTKYSKGLSFHPGGYKERIELFLNVLNHILIGFITIYMSWLCIRLNLLKTALHAWLVTIGFCFLMAEAVMCHYECNALTFSYKRKTKTTIHWILQVLGGGCGLAGCLVKMIEKGFLFSSIHGKLGLIAFILCLISFITGLSAFFSQRMKRIIKPLNNKTIHNFIGLATFILTMIAQFYGYRSGFFRKNVSQDFIQLMKIITLISLFLTCIGPLKAFYFKCLTISLKS